MTPNPDRDLAALIDDLRSKQDEAWKAFIERILPLVAVVCRGRGIPTLTDDVVQETALAIFHGLENPPEEWASWIATIIRNKCVDAVRKERPRQRRQMDGPEVEARLVELWDPEKDTSSPREIEEEVARIIQQTDLRERELAAALLHYVEGLPYREIADLLEVTPENARQLAWRGIAAMRQIAAERGHEVKWKGELARRRMPPRPSGRPRGA